MMRLSRFGKSGFTLVELMVVVAIVAILAAIAIPAFIKYIRKSKAAEAFTMLQGIREKEEAYFAEFKVYSNTIEWTPHDEDEADDADKCGSNHFWNLDPGDPNDSRWLQLGFSPGGPTYHTYRVETGYGDNGRLEDGYRATADDNFPANLEPWFVVMAAGDIDCDGAIAYFFLTSHNQKPVKTDAAENPDDEVY